MSHIWTTADEVVFLRGIGAHSATRTPRRLLLEQYRHAAANRVDWGGLQPDIILTEVCRQLERFTRSAR